MPRTRSSSGHRTMAPTRPTARPQPTLIPWAASGTASRSVARWVLHLAGGLQPHAVPGALAGQGPCREGQQRAGAHGRLVHDAAGCRGGDRSRRPDHRRDGHARLPARRRRGIRPRHGAVPAGRPSAGGQVAPVEVELFAQDGFYSTWTPLNMPHRYNLEWDARRGAPGQLPARLGRPPDGRRRGLPEEPRGRAADQARDARPVHAAQAWGAPPPRSICRSARPRRS